MQADLLDFEMVAEARDILGPRYFESLERFAKQGRERLAIIRAEIDKNGDPAVIAFEAHSFKFSAACLGARVFPSVAQNLEVAARSLAPGATLSPLEIHWYELEKSFEALQSAFSDIPRDSS